MLAREGQTVNSKIISLSLGEIETFREISRKRIPRILRRMMELRREERKLEEEIREVEEQEKELRLKLEDIHKRLEDKRRKLEGIRGRLDELYLELEQELGLGVEIEQKTRLEMIDVFDSSRTNSAGLREMIKKETREAISEICGILTGRQLSDEEISFVYNFLIELVDRVSKMSRA